MLPKISISLIVPCYNEETNIQKGVLDKIGNFTKNDERFVEVLIVDDGSIDNSRRIIRYKYLTQFSKYRLVENEHQGKAFAIITGIQKSKGSYVLFSDIDLATPIEEADKLINQARKGIDIVIGSRSGRREGAPLLRKIMSHGAVVVKNMFLGLKAIKDTQCGFKMFERSKALTVINRLQVFRHNHKIKGSSVSAAFDLEFLFLATKMNLNIKEVSVTWRHVETKNVNFAKDTFETLSDILKMKYYALTNQYAIT